MKERKHKLKVTPIKEIILSFSFDGILNTDSKEAFYSWLIKNTEFKNKQTTFVHNINIKIDKEQPSPKTNSDYKEDGFIIKTNANDEQVNLRQGLLSVHVFDKYKSCEDISRETIRIWNALTDVAELKIKSISLRYINFIPYWEEDLELKNILNIYPNHPYNSSNSMVNLRFALEGIYRINLIVVDTIHNQQKGAILDYSLKRDVEPNISEDEIIKLLKKYRLLKNDIFFDAISDLTYKHYN